MAEFFALGGYGAYIWPCYLLSVILLGWLTWHSYRDHRRTKAQLEAALSARDAK